MKLKLGNALREHIERTGITYRKLSKKIGLSSSTLFSWAHGCDLLMNEKNLVVLDKLKNELGFVSIVELLFGKEQEFTSKQIRILTKALQDIIIYEIEKRIEGVDGNKK